MLSTATIRVPESISVFTTFAFHRELAKMRSCDVLVVDFSRLTNVEPFGLLLVAESVREYRKLHPGVLLRCAGHESKGYAAHMGLFRACGFDSGREPGEARGGRNYLPLTYFESGEFAQAAARTGSAVGDEIEAQSRRLTQTLIGMYEGEVFETLAYSMREIMRNVVEHANAEQFGVCAQYWPTKGRAEVAIVDRGIGLRESLRSNPHLDASDDKAAINYALMPAVSGKAFKGARRRGRSSHWDNSGFGLYMTSRLCRTGGNFFVASGDKGMLLTTAQHGKRYFDTDMAGTSVRMTIRTENVAALRDTLDRFKREGQEIQNKYKEIASISPSSASMMLSQDFDLGLWERLLKELKGSAR